MSNVFLHHIYVMYFIWFAAGVMLLAYIAWRRKRIKTGPSTNRQNVAPAAHH